MLNNNILTQYQAEILTATRKMDFENILGKGENASNQHFLLFRTMFLCL